MHRNNIRHLSLYYTGNAMHLHVIMQEEHEREWICDQDEIEWLNLQYQEMAPHRPADALLHANYLKKAFLEKMKYSMCLEKVLHRNHNKKEKQKIWFLDSEIRGLHKLNSFQSPVSWFLRRSMDVRRVILDQEDGRDPI